MKRYSKNVFLGIFFLCLLLSTPVHAVCNGSGVEPFSDNGTVFPESSLPESPTSSFETSSSETPVLYGPGGDPIGGLPVGGGYVLLMAAGLVYGGIRTFKKNFIKDNTRL